jgi:hypothetical protein
LWRCSDGLFFEVPPLASDALLTTLHSLLKNVLQTVDHFEISCLGAPLSWLEKPRNRMGRDPNLNSVFVLEKVDRWNPIRTSAIQARNFEVINGLQQVSRSGWSVVRSASLDKGGTSKKRPSLHLHKVPTRSNKLSPRTLQTALLDFINAQIVIFCVLPLCSNPIFYIKSSHSFC